MAAFVAKQMLGSKMSAVKGECLARVCVCFFSCFTCGRDACETADGHGANCAGTSRDQYASDESEREREREHRHRCHPAEKVERSPPRPRLLSRKVTRRPLLTRGADAAGNFIIRACRARQMSAGTRKLLPSTVQSKCHRPVAFQSFYKQIKTNQKQTVL